MRTDCTIDTQQVMCPKASRLGFGQLYARFGDFIQYREHYTDGTHSIRYARVLGRVAYAPACGETPAIKDHILVAAIAEDLEFGYERWIDPDDVTEINRPADARRGFLHWFISDWTAQDRRDVQEVRRALSQGYTTDVRARVAEVKARIAAQPAHGGC